MPAKTIEVLAYAGHRDEEEPRSFLLDGEKIQIEQIDKRWLEEGPDRGRKRFFKVRARDGFSYTLFYDEESHGWYLSG